MWGPLLLLFSLCSQVPLTAASDQCVDESSSDDLTRFWYVWFVLVIMGTLVALGIIVTCFRFCCRASKSPMLTYPGQHFEVAVIGGDNESTIHSSSTISSISGHTFNRSPSHMFAPRLASCFSPPPYKLYALESPPQYEDAVKMPVQKGVGEPECQARTGATNSSVMVESPYTVISEDQLEGPVIEDPPASLTTTDSSTWEEDPPEYQLYDPVAEENFTEIALDEEDPMQNQPVDSQTSQGKL
ncbi:transmembrane protein 52 isoform X1 [Arapaima gigas]